MGTPTGPQPARNRTLATRLLLLGAAACIVLATVMVLLDREPAAAAFAAAAGVLTLSARAAAMRGGLEAELLAESFLDRAFDAGVLSAVAWTARRADPETSVGALVAMAIGFLAAYVPARGGSLGYGIGESPVTRALRYLLVALGLALGWLGWVVWALAAVSGLALLVRTSQVAKEERA